MKTKVTFASFSSGERVVLAKGAVYYTGESILSCQSPLAAECTRVLISGSLPDTNLALCQGVVGACVSVSYTCAVLVSFKCLLTLTFL